MIDLTGTAFAIKADAFGPPPQVGVVFSANNQKATLTVTSKTCGCGVCGQLQLLYVWHLLSVTLPKYSWTEACAQGDRPQASSHHPAAGASNHLRQQHPIRRQLRGVPVIVRITIHLQQQHLRWAIP